MASKELDTTVYLGCVNSSFSTLINRRNRAQFDCTADRISRISASNTSSRSVLGFQANSFLDRLAVQRAVVRFAQLGAFGLSTGTDNGVASGMAPFAWRIEAI